MTVLTNRLTSNNYYFDCIARVSLAAVVIAIWALFLFGILYFIFYSDRLSTDSGFEEMGIGVGGMWYIYLGLLLLSCALYE